MKIHPHLLVAGGIAALCFAADWSEMPIRDRQTNRQVLPLSGPPMRVSVENLNGYVHVIGSSSHDVELTTEKIIRADSDSDLSEARKNVNLEVNSRPGTVSVLRRSQDDDNHGRHPRHFYLVTYNIDLKIPSAARAFLSTVNGDLGLQDTSGDFELRSVNGGVLVRSASGSGSVHTVNGAVKAIFARNPQARSDFGTVNGSIDVTLQSNPSATLTFQTVHGEMFSDFDVTAGQDRPVESERQDGKFIYRANGPKTMRLGTGGPELRFETVNGSVRLHRAGKDSYAN